MGLQVRIGIDFGGVIIQNDALIQTGQTGEVFLDSDDCENLAQPFAIEVIRDLVSTFDGRIWIVSKAKTQMQERTQAWLTAVNFFSRTALEANHLRFCTQREEKATICAELGITHFIDDSMSIIQILRGIVPHLYLFGEKPPEPHRPEWVTFVEDWTEVMDRIIAHTT